MSQKKPAKKAPQRDVPAPKPAEQPASEPHEKRYGGGTRDVVDEASWESFPASDPPAW